jgi:hypothetical protein
MEQNAFFQNRIKGGCMSGIKGLVLLTRLDYIEQNFGKDKLKSFTDKLNKNRIQYQPVSISKEYSEELLNLIDEAIKDEIFESDITRFRELGLWNAPRLMPRYFQVYITEKKPADFLKQYAIIRDFLIGLGNMKIVELGKNSFMFHLNYGQPWSESVRLSELGVIEGGLVECGAKNVKLLEEQKTGISIDYKVFWENG